MTAINKYENNSKTVIFHTPRVGTATNAPINHINIINKYNYGTEEYYFHFALSIGMFCALFSSMFLGTESFTRRPLSIKP